MTLSWSMARPHDAVVVGAGPAGLSAAAEIAATATCLLIEQGRRHTARDRDAPEDILSGVGGAGLFSDGKHSFFPSATELWRLPDRARLERAYERTRALLAAHGVLAPPFPREELAPAPSMEGGAGWRLKEYPSMYASLGERMACIRELYARSGGPPRIEARVVGARRIPSPSGPMIELTVEQGGDLLEIQARRLVVATGRLSPLWTRSWLTNLGVAWSFRRLELGVRIETRADSPLFARLQGIDPKLILRQDEPPFEIRTFCVCRDGEVVLGSTCNMHAFSGRGDGPRTGRSNLGLLVRTSDPALSRAIEGRLLAPGGAPLRASLLGVLRERGRRGGLAATFGEEGAALILRALDRFIEHAPELAGDPSATLYAPCIEGVGDYPVDDGDLGIAPGVWMAGDLCGRFRGIVASMISGRYVGGAVAPGKAPG